MVPPEGLWSTWRRPPDASTMRLLDPRLRRPARAALAGAAAVRPCSPAGSARPAAPDADAAAFLDTARSRLADPRPRGVARAAGTSRAPSRRPSRRTTAPRPPSPPTRPSSPSCGGRPRRGGRRAVRAPTSRSSPRPSPGRGCSYWTPRGREARGGLGGRGAGRKRARWTASSTSRSRPQACRARGVSLRLEDFELRMEDGTLFSTPDDARAHARSPSWAARRVRFSPAPARRARAAPPVRRRDGPRPRGRLGLRAPAPRRLPPRARERARSRAGAGPGRAPRARRSACCASRSAAQLHRSTRRFPARRGG